MTIRIIVRREMPECRSEVARRRLRNLSEGAKPPEKTDYEQDYSVSYS